MNLFIVLFSLFGMWVLMMFGWLIWSIRHPVKVRVYQSSERMFRWEFVFETHKYTNCWYQIKYRYVHGFDSQQKCLEEARKAICQMDRMILEEKQARKLKRSTLKMFNVKCEEDEHENVS